MSNKAPPGVTPLVIAVLSTNDSSEASASVSIVHLFGDLGIIVPGRSGELLMYVCIYSLEGGIMVTRTQEFVTAQPRTMEIVTVMRGQSSVRPQDRRCQSMNYAES